jgi:hypothetical protein
MTASICDFSSGKTGLTRLFRRSHSALFAAAYALAAYTASSPASAANAWIGPFPISSVISSQSGGFLLLLNAASDPACGSSGNQFNAVPTLNGMTSDGAKSALAVLLTALALNKQVSIIMDDTQSGCPIAQVRVDQ